MNKLIKFCFYTAALLSNFMLFAQGDENDTGNLEGNDPAPAPINGKLIFLAIAGILFAIYTFKNNRRKA